MHENEFWSIFQQTRSLYKKKTGTPDFGVGGWSMFQQTRPLYTKPFVAPPAPPPPPELMWPRIIYAATRGNGVYYTENFGGPNNQPIWTAINDGLVSLDCWEFHLDPFNQIYRQFVLTSDGTLYRRENGGAWVNIFDGDDRTLLTGAANFTHIGGFFPDTTIEGRIWYVGSSSANGQEWAFRSDDFGDTWHTCGHILDGPIRLDTIRACGDRIWVGDSCCVGAYAYIEFSLDGGLHWSYAAVNIAGSADLEFNPLKPLGTYYGVQWGTGNVAFFSDHVEYGYFPPRITTGSIWFSQFDINYQKAVCSNEIYVTHDEWVTNTHAGILFPTALEIIAPWAGDNEDRMIIGLSNYGVGADHVIGILHDNNDATPTGIAGSNPATPPYTNSIPKTQNLCKCGIQCPREQGIIYI